MRLVLFFAVALIFSGCLARSGDDGEPSSGGENAGAGSSAGGSSTSGGGADGGGTSSSGGSAIDPTKDDCPPFTKTVGVFNLGKAEELLELEGVTTLDGSLHVGWVLEDFSGLSCLTEITGNLTIKGATDLRSLAGLERLRTLGGTLLVGESCPHEGAGFACEAINAIEDLSLPALQKAGKLHIQYNPELVDVSFPSLESTESIYFGLNPKLAEVHFGSLRETEELMMLSLPALAEVTAPALSRVPSIHVESTGIGRIDFLSGVELHDVILVGNTALASVAPLAGTTELNALAIRDSEVMTDLDGLQDLKVATEGIGMSWNTALTSLEALENLERVGGLSLSTLPLLEDLSGLENLRTIDGRLSISDIDELRSLDGLHPDIQVGELSIGGNPELKSLEGLESLAVVPGLVYVARNSALVDLSGLDNLTSVGRLLLSSNGGLTSLAALGALTEVSEEFRIESCPLVPTCEVDRLLDRLDAPPMEVWLGATDDDASCDAP